MEPIFFQSQRELRDWLEQHHDKEQEVWVGFYKKGATRAGITYAEAVDEALCFGWIDGIRKGVDEEGYANRFTPRKARSIWSAVNIKRVGELTEMGLMHPAGLKTFEARQPERSNAYSFEQGDIELGTAFEEEFRHNEGAWSYFQAQPAGYKKTAIWWVISAKREETKQKRLQTLIADSAEGKRLAHLTYTPKG